MKPEPETSFRIPVWSREASAKRGFSLIEMVIVITALGVVLTGVAIGSSMAWQRLQTNQASDELAIIVDNMRAAYNGTNASYSPIGGVPSPDFNQNNDYVRKGVFPAEMLSPRPLSGALPGTTTVANHPWAQDPVYGTARVDQVGTVGAPLQLVVRYAKLNQQQCADMIMRNSMPGGETGLIKVVITSSNSGVSKTCTNTAEVGCLLPIAPSDADDRCGDVWGGADDPGPFDVDWYYTLNPNLGNYGDPD
ncbi:MAG: prepilin-type N-terminal cleavage/methylation domain-containing protein [Alphaproteobacteria bacterium]|nr:prepilin-type N-terminal cleavage/methylation domain-containing protein [Alphaproteobacteria bacterium]